MSRILTRLVLVMALLALTMSVTAVPVAAGNTPTSYLVLSTSDRLPAGLESKVAAVGGTVLRAIPEIGVIVVRAADPAFPARAASLKGVRSVTRNITVSLIDPPAREALTVSVGTPPFSGDDDFFYDMQWGHAAIGSPTAWNAGLRGAGVRVAVLDTGFDLDHVDLAPNINYALSKNFVPGETLGYALPDPFSHGTHTAGLVAAADNGFGTIGVAPEAELVLLKVLGDEGSGDFDWLLQAIVYAANVGADVASMSLGALLPTHLPDGSLDVEVAELRLMLFRAATYAIARGTTLIASAGNEAHDGDSGDGLIHLPSDTPGLIAVSATTPIGWAVDPTTDLDVPTSYTNYGVSVIDLAAPGGDVLYPGNENCTVAGRTRPCWVFDLVFSTGSNLDPTAASYFWAGGTSMAAPHVAGVAALIIGKYGGSLSPKLVGLALKQTADDLGPLGADAFYGYGRVNAGNVVTLP